MTLVYISLFFSLLSGLFRAAYSSRIFHGTESRLFFVIRHHLYVGGKENGYNQSLPWTADFAHRMIYLEWLTNNLSGILIGVAAFSDLWLIAFWPLVWAIEGWTFTLFFHYVFQIPPDGGVKHFLLRVLMPWR